MKKLFVLFCAALLLVGLSFGEASATRLEFGGYVTANGTGTGRVTLTGWFDWATSGTVTVTGTGSNAYTTYANMTGSYDMVWGGQHVSGTVMDARVFSDYSSTPNDLFRISTGTDTGAPGFSTFPRFQIDIVNKIGTAKTNTLLQQGTGLPISLNLIENPGGTYGPQTPWSNTNEYTHAQAFYYFSSSSSTGFTLEDLHFVPDAAAPVPEPATMLLLGSGLIGLAGFGRKKLFKKA